MGWTFYNASGEAMIQDGAMTIANNTNNRVVTATGADPASLNGESALTFDGEHLTVGDGNLVIGTAGHGIDFAAQTGVGSGAGVTASVSELLDHYEEGTWTPVARTIADDTATQGVQVGLYTRIGNVVFVQFASNSNDISGLTGSDAMFIYGLPFTSTSTSGAEGNIHSGNGYSLAITAGNTMSGSVPTDKAYVQLMVWSATTGSVQMTATQWSVGGNVRMSGHYFI
jgi:hypothetical protein